MTSTRTIARSSGTITRPGHVAAVRRAVVETSDDTARTIAVCLVPWGEVARVTDDGRSFYDESWTPGSLEPDPIVAVFDGHRPTPAGVERGALIGRATGLEDRADGLYATLELADSTAGRDAYALARTMGAVHVSIEADVPTSSDGGAIVRSADDPSVLTGVAICWPPTSGVFAGAVGAARSTVEPDPDEDPDEDDEDDDEDDTTARGRVAELVRAEIARFGFNRTSARATSPLARFASFDTLSEAARTASRDEAAALSREFTTAYRQHRDRVRAARSGPIRSHPTIPAWSRRDGSPKRSGSSTPAALGSPPSADRVRPMTPASISTGRTTTVT